MPSGNTESWSTIPDCANASLPAPRFWHWTSFTLIELISFRKLIQHHICEQDVVFTRSVAVSNIYIRIQCVWRCTSADPLQSTLAINGQLQYLSRYLLRSGRTVSYCRHFLLRWCDWYRNPEAIFMCESMSGFQRLGARDSKRHTRSLKRLLC